MTRRDRWGAGLGIFLPVLIIVLLAIFWNWDWFIPIVDSRASAALGRKVTIAHLHVALARIVTVRADTVIIANPPGFSSPQPLAKIRQLTVRFDIVAYLFHHKTVVPLIDLNHPVIDAVATSAKTNNYTLKPAKSAQPAPPPEIGTLTIEGGRIHFVDPKLKADLHLILATQKAAGIVAAHHQTQELTVKATGTYNAQPITGTMIAGTLLTLRNTAQPYPLDLALANGTTHVTLVGVVQNPLNFQGANVQLTLTGDSMDQLYALTGIPIPSTPKYHLTGRLDYDRKPGTINFTNVHGLVGDSDLNGTVAEKPGAILGSGKAKPSVTMTLYSKHVDLNDLGGFIGTKPGGQHESGTSPAQRAKIAAAEAHSRNFLPDKPFNLPKLNAANIHLHYKAASIEGRSMPLDNLVVTMDIVNGAIRLHPISFGVGTGRIAGNIALTPAANNLIHAQANVMFDKVDIARMMAATHVFKGAGTLRGKATLNATGNSIASWAGNGNGGMALYMTGGNLSALLVSLSGLEFGNAVIAALGLPKQTDVRCFVGDFALNRGLLTTKTLLLDTGTAVVFGGGTVNLKTERLNLRIQSKPKHFSIGSLPSPIDITGPMKKPSIGPAKKPLVERGAAMAVLGVVAAPLALLPTIQFGVKDPHACKALVTEAETQDRDDKPGQTTRPAPHSAVPQRKSTTNSLNVQELQKVQHQKP